jgi:2-hydroxy-4-carboxymuconate semialdehyde hemiacetal dehydrogenase
MTELGLCLVGPGAIAGAHAKAHTAGSLTEKLWVVGPTDERAAAFASEWGFAHSTAQLAEALGDDAVELVLITSPNGLHTEQALLSLEAGKHVIVEIPVGLSLSDAVAVADRAAATGRRAFVCHTMRSFPAIRYLRERVQAGELNISQINGFTTTPRRHNENWIGGTREWVDNLLWHNSCHYLDACLWVLGATEAKNVTAQFGRPNPEFGMTMDVSVSFKTPKNELVTYSGSYNAADGVSHMLFVADEGLFRLERSRLLDDQGNELFEAAEWADLRRQDTAIVEAIRGGTPSDFEIDTVLPTMRLLAQAQEWEGAEPR